jgi:hypothetical protein
MLVSVLTSQTFFAYFPREKGGTRKAMRLFRNCTFVVFHDILWSMHRQKYAAYSYSPTPIHDLE